MCLSIISCVGGITTSMAAYEIQSQLTEDRQELYDAIKVIKQGYYKYVKLQYKYKKVQRIDGVWVSYKWFKTPKLRTTTLYR